MAFDNTTPTASDALSLQELELYHMMMDYRAQKGLPPIPLSQGLTTTAGRHAADWIENIWRAGATLPDGANLHSWSDAPYFSDHRDPEVMWQAPQRIGSSYTGNGYEISAAGYSSLEATLAGWQGSSGHDAVISNTGMWGNLEWMSIGIGVEIDPTAGGPYGGRIYHVWFGDETDPAGAPKIAGTGAADEIEGTAFADAIASGGEADTVMGGDGHDTIKGGGGGDRLELGAGDDKGTGNGGKDDIFGGDGADRIKGAGGNDFIMGEAGDDTLDGGKGRDVLAGGEGDDLFVFRKSFGADVIEDFGPGDSVRIKGRGEVSDAADLADALIPVGPDTVYDAGGDGKNTILFVDVQVSELTADVFGLA